METLQAENAELRRRLEEAEETLRAIREGEVDAVIVSGSHGDRVFSLTETENLHRQMVETMNEAGLAISPDGLLLYCNARVATLLKRPRGALLGRRLEEFVAPQDAGRLHDLLVASAQGTADDRVVFRAADETGVPLHLWASRLHRPEGPLVCLVGTDLSRLEAERALVVQLQEQQQALSASRAEALDLMRQAVAAREDTARVAQGAGAARQPRLDGRGDRRALDRGGPATLGRHSASRAHLARGRPRPLGASLGEPPQQCEQVHGRRRRHPAHGRAARRRGGAFRARYGCRHP